MTPKEQWKRKLADAVNDCVYYAKKLAASELAVDNLLDAAAELVADSLLEESDE